MRRRTLLLVLAGLAVVAAGVVVLWPAPPSRITRENYDRIRVGMSRVEVEAILGSPGDYSTREIAYLLEEPTPVEGWPIGDNEEWCGDRASIDVAFTPTGTLMWARFWEGLPTDPDEGPLHNLLWRAKRQWHGWFP
jgi:hypothetical protein